MNLFKNGKFIAVAGVTAVALTALTFYYTSNNNDTTTDTQDVATETTSNTDNTTAVEPAVLTTPGEETTATEAVILEGTPTEASPAADGETSSYYRAPPVAPNKPMIIMVRHVNGASVPCTDAAQSTQD